MGPLSHPLARSLKKYNSSIQKVYGSHSFYVISKRNDYVSVGIRFLTSLRVGGHIDIRDTKSQYLYRYLCQIVTFPAKEFFFNNLSRHTSIIMSTWAWYRWILSLTSPVRRQSVPVSIGEPRTITARTTTAACGNHAASITGDRPERTVSERPGALPR